MRAVVLCGYLRIFFVAMATWGLFTTACAETIELREFVTPPNSTPGEEVYDKVIDIGHSVRLRAHVDITTKGNGLLEFGGLALRVYDAHNDGDMFDPPLLHVEWIDIDGDGYKELICLGTLKHTGEKGQLAELEPILSIYRYDPKLQRFKLMYRVGPDLAQ